MCESGRATVAIDDRDIAVLQVDEHACSRLLQPGKGKSNLREHTLPSLTSGTLYGSACSGLDFIRSRQDGGSRLAGSARAGSADWQPALRWRDDRHTKTPVPLGPYLDRTALFPGPLAQ